MEHTTLVAAISAMLGAALPILTKFAIDFFTVKRRAQLDERADVWNEATKLRQDLMGQILDLRSIIVKLQEDNLKYVVENTQLKGQLAALQREIDEVKKDLAAREQEITSLRAERDDLESARNLLQEKMAGELAALADEVHRMRVEGKENANLVAPITNMQALNTPAVASATPMPQP